jgi:hypothetical protein
MRPQSFLGTYFPWRFEKLKFKLRFCGGMSILSCICQVVFLIEKRTMRRINAFYELSNETSFVSGGLIFMDNRNFEVPTLFL